MLGFEMSKPATPGSRNQSTPLTEPHHLRITSGPELRANRLTSLSKKGLREPERTCSPESYFARAFCQDILVSYKTPQRRSTKAMSLAVGIVESVQDPSLRRGKIERNLAHVRASSGGIGIASKRHDTGSCEGCPRRQRLAACRPW